MIVKRKCLDNEMAKEDFFFNKVAKTLDFMVTNYAHIRVTFPYDFNGNIVVLMSAEKNESEILEDNDVNYVSIVLTQKCQFPDEKLMVYEDVKEYLKDESCCATFKELENNTGFECWM